MKSFSKIQSHIKSLFEKKEKKPKIIIGEVDEDSIVANVETVGITTMGLGAVILKTEDSKEFPISAFSAEVAKNISDFKEGKRDEIPTTYNMLEHICEETGVLLVKVRVYDSGEALRANLYFTGKKEFILRNFKASDAIALATFYNIPVLLKKSLLENNQKIKSK